MSSSGSAAVQGDLWGARADAWARHEVQGVPIFEELLARSHVVAGTRLLDLGCAAGTLCELAAARGAHVSGLDAADALLEIARRRVPSGDFRSGDVQLSPFEDDSFDVVTAVNCLQFAADSTEALREAARVTRPGGTVAVALWGPPEQVDLFVPVRALGALVPGPTTRRPLLEPGALESAMEEVGLSVRETHDASMAFEFSDDEDMLDQMTSAGGIVRVVRTVREERARSALLEAMQRFRTDAGGYRLVNAWHAAFAERPAAS